jgi:hypothetical protein
MTRESGCVDTVRSLQMQLEEVTDMQQVERIVGKKAVVVLNDGSDRTVDCILVKWQGLSYDCCSWEWASDSMLPAVQVCTCASIGPAFAFFVRCIPVSCGVSIV